LRFKTGKPPSSSTQIDYPILPLLSFPHNQNQHPTWLPVAIHSDSNGGVAVNTDDDYDDDQDKEK